MRPVELAQEDSGGRRTLFIGDDVVVALVENPSTGYRWQAEFDPLVLEATDDRFEATSDLRGAPGVRYSAFRALASGQTELRLINRRGWETGEGIGEFVIDLDIRP
jgi:inhibitor of cysteine peptidase